LLAGASAVRADIINGGFDNGLDGYGVVIPAVDPSLALVEVVGGRLHIVSSNTYTWDGTQWQIGEPDNAGIMVAQTVPEEAGFWAPAGTDAIEFDAEVAVTGVPALPAGNMSAFAWFTINYNGAVNFSDFLTDVDGTVHVDMPGLVPDNNADISFVVSVYSLLDAFPEDPQVDDSITVTVDSYFDNFHFVPEPASMLVLAAGALAIVARRRRRRS